MKRGDGVRTTVRDVMQYHTLDGKLLAEHDPLRDAEAVPQPILDFLKAMTHEAVPRAYRELHAAALAAAGLPAQDRPRGSC